MLPYLSRAPLPHLALLSPAEVTAEWFTHVQAPAKRLVWFEHSAHMAMVEEPGRVLVHLVQDVLPLAALSARPAGD